MATTIARGFGALTVTSSEFTYFPIKTINFITDRRVIWKCWFYSRSVNSRKTTLSYQCLIFVPLPSQKHQQPVDEGQKQTLVTDVNVAIEVGISQRMNYNQ